MQPWDCHCGTRNDYTLPACRRCGSARQVAAAAVPMPLPRPGPPAAAGGRIISCGSCLGSVSPRAASCPHCGDRLTDPEPVPLPFWWIFRTTALAAVSLAIVSVAAWLVMMVFRLLVFRTLGGGD